MKILTSEIIAKKIMNNPKPINIKQIIDTFWYPITNKSTVLAFYLNEKKNRFYPFNYYKTSEYILGIGYEIKCRDEDDHINFLMDEGIIYHNDEYLLDQISYHIVGDFSYLIDINDSNHIINIYNIKKVKGGYKYIYLYKTHC